MINLNNTALSSGVNVVLLSPLSAGYGDMEAQFAWDDKTIRKTFIRKVRM